MLKNETSHWLLDRYQPLTRECAKLVTREFRPQYGLRVYSFRGKMVDNDRSREDCLLKT